VIPAESDHRVVYNGHLKTTPTDLRPIKQMRLVRFDGQRYAQTRSELNSDYSDRLLGH
jgi:hypothetical protein